MRPDYVQIYKDLIENKYPERKGDRVIERKLQNLYTALDVIQLNEMITGCKTGNISDNQKLRAYDREAVIQILEYQKAHKLNNIQTAEYFRTSRNTIAKWKKSFVV